VEDKRWKAFKNNLNQHSFITLGLNTNLYWG